MKKILSILLLLSATAQAKKEVETSKPTTQNSTVGTKQSDPSSMQLKEEEKRKKLYDDFNKNQHSEGFIATAGPKEIDQKDAHKKTEKQSELKAQEEWEKEIALLKQKLEAKEKARKEAVEKFNAAQQELEKKADSLSTQGYVTDAVHNMEFSTIFSIIPLVSRVHTLLTDYLKDNPALEKSFNTFKKDAHASFEQLHHTFKEVQKVMQIEELYMDEQLTHTIKALGSEFKTLLKTIPHSSDKVTPEQTEAIKKSVQTILVHVNKATSTVLHYVAENDSHTSTQVNDTSAKQPVNKAVAQTKQETTQTIAKPTVTEQK